MKNHSSIILKIKFLKQLRSIFPFLVFFCCWTGVFFYYFQDVNFSNVPPLTLKGIIVLAFGISLLAFITLPALLFHIDYFIRNRHEEYEIGNKKIIKRKNGEETVCNFEEIEDIHMYVTPPKFREDLRFTAWDDYHFAKIIMKSGEVLYLTSLLYPSGIDKVLKKYFKGMSYLSVKCWFPTTLKDYSHDEHDEHDECDNDME